MLSYTALTLVAIYLTNYYEQKEEQIERLSTNVSEIELSILNSLKAQNQYLIHETINPKYFTKGESEYLKLNDSLSNQILNQIDELSANEWIISLEFDDEFLRLKNLYSEYHHVFIQLSETLLRKGFKNWGVEGRMRDYAHILEEYYSDYIDRADLLMLRRHEKDFILRKEEKYVLKFELQCDLIRQKLHDELIDSITRKELFKKLNNYERSFMELSRLETFIGLRNNSGFKAHVDNKAKQLINELEEVKAKMELAQTKLIDELRWYYFIGLFVFISFSLFASFQLSRSMTDRIKKLTNELNKFVQSNFKEVTSRTKPAKDEVGKLTKNIKIMEEEIAVHFENYREKVEKRTEEILYQQEELVKRQSIIETKNKDILYSIKYAKKIQDSILPEKFYMQQLLKEFFVIYKPKDIVSGDFYWVERSFNKVFVAVADCTGHGVPGAFMSIMGYNFLNQAVNEKKLSRPDHILNYMNVAISSSLGQNKANGIKIGEPVKIQDGMDIALISIDFSKNELCYSGAQRPVVITRKSELIELRGDRFPVGGAAHGRNKRFSLEKVLLMPGDNIYLFSDGFADQFGGKKNKKFKYPKLRDLLYSIKYDSVEIQKNIIIESYDAWKGNHDQVDDVCMLGIKI